MMNKKLSISLSISGIDKAITELTDIGKKIDNIDKLLTKEIADDAANYLRTQYEHRPYTIISDKSDLPETPSIDVVETQSGYQIIGRGEDILYDEFGTGDVGKSSGYDENVRSTFMAQGLKDYNTGKYVSKNIDKNGRHYWYYNGVRTDGIPAGKQFLNTRNYILQKGIKKAKEKVMGDIL